MSITFKAKDVVVYIAGAGSGKTTALRQDLTGMLKVYKPNEVAFTTFTKKGVATGIEQVMQHTRLEKSDLLYFQTLHSMCFRQSGLTKVNMLENKDIDAFNKTTGYKLSSVKAWGNQSEDDRLLERYNAIRSGAKQGIIIHAKYDEERYYRLTKAYEKFKEVNNLVDFYDCLLRYMEVGKPLPCAALFLDEAQDVTALQWRVITKASQNCEKIRIAGDPMQAIFSYQGAEPGILISLAKKYHTVELNRTYRLPERICVLADTIVEVTQEKMPRKHIPVKKIKGHVQEIVDREVFGRIIKKDYAENSKQPYRWFVLFRCNHFLSDVTSVLEQLIIPYHTSEDFVLADRELNKIRRYYDHRKEGYSTEKRRLEFMERYGIKDINDCFTESNLIPSSRRYIYLDYVEKYGIDALIVMSKAPPFCLVTTVHKVKGGEADNVAVFLDATPQVQDNVIVDADQELRIFYVACTRAKESLYVVQPVRKFNIRDVWESVVAEGGPF